MKYLKENSFQINNLISISNKVKKIPFFNEYFSPIIKIKNYDENYNEINSKNEINIKYKLLEFDENIEELNIERDFIIYFYHILNSINILNKNKICFITEELSIKIKNDMPIIYNLSNSFYFPNIDLKNIYLFLNELINIKYIPIELYVIIYMEKFKKEKLENNLINEIINTYTCNREKIEKKYCKEILDYLMGSERKIIIKYLWQFKETWSQFSILYYMYQNHEELLVKYKLNEIINEYINNIPFKRNKNILNILHNQMFVNI